MIPFGHMYFFYLVLLFLWFICMWSHLPVVNIFYVCHFDQCMFVNAHEWACLKIGINVWMRLKTFKEFFVILSCMISLILQDVIILFICIFHKYMSQISPNWIWGIITERFLRVCLRENHTNSYGSMLKNNTLYK